MKVRFYKQTTVPGSEVARDKWFVQKNKMISEKKLLPQAAKLPGASDLFKERSDLGEKFCPRQRSCPGQVACSKKCRIFEKKLCPRQRSCPGQVASSKKSDFLEKICPRQVARSRESHQPLQPRARSAFGGVQGAEPPGMQGGAGGARRPRHPSKLYPTLLKPRP